MLLSGSSVGYKDHHFEVILGRYLRAAVISAILSE